MLAISPVGMIGPLAGDIARTWNLTPEVVGLTIMFLSLPAVFIGVLMGWLIDRLGARRMLVISASAIFLASLTSTFATSLLWLQLGLLITGISFIAVLTAAQVLIMITTEGNRQVRALAFWSTVAPVGLAAGMLIVARFAGSAGWQMGFGLHATLLAVLIASAFLVPNVRGSAQPGLPRESSARVLRNMRVLRLGLAFACGVLVAFGVVTVLPMFLERFHELAPSTVAPLLAISSLAGILGSLGTGVLLTRGLSPRSVALLIAGLAWVSAVATFAPGMPLLIIAAGVLLLQLAGGGCIALVFALLPRLVESPAQAGTAAGLVNQLQGLGSAAAAPLFFGLLGTGLPVTFVVATAAAWLAFLLLVPVWQRARPLPATA
jgi:predicted MFS family arabinose efflux permease